MLINFDKQAGNVYTQLSDKSNHIIQNSIRIQEWRLSNQLHKKIKDSKHTLITQDQVIGHYISSSAISNGFQFVVSGGSEQKLKKWNQSTLIKSIQLDKWISYIKFTDDSKLLYVGKQEVLYQFDVNSNFQETYKQALHQEEIINIFCITNTIILTSSTDKTIIKTDINLKQQLLYIKAYNDRINGLDYNSNLYVIASSSNDKSIKLWNRNNGQIILEKQNAHNNKCDLIFQVIFIIKNSQLISLDNINTIIIWNINQETKQLNKQQQISDTKIYNISLVLNQQYIASISEENIKVYTVEGDYIAQFNHDVKELNLYNTIQQQSMKAFIIKGLKIPKICKVEVDLD